MAQDQKKALDDKTRRLAGERIENGKEHAAYQESQQQLLAIQAEQQQNLAVARAESKASFDNNQTLAQAAELGAISAAEAEQAAQAGEQVTLNPATQQILNKYGAGQPKFQRSQSHSQQVTKQNITINNNITSNTTNDVKVPANIGGPLQGRPLQIKSVSVPNEGSTGKFKTWISAAFARQNEEGAKRDREYRHRESSLTKSANKMMKKLEDIGKTIGTRMDPRKIGSTWQSQLKTLLLLFGFGYLTSNWSKVLSTAASIEGWIKKVWEYFSGDAKEGKRTFISDIKSFLGAKNGESIFEALKELFVGNDGFLGLLKKYFSGLAEERSRAMKMVKFPEIDLGDLVGTIKNLGLYLGDLLSAMVSGSSGIKSNIERNIKDISNKGAFEQAEKDSKTMSTSRFKTLSNRELDADVGIGAILNNKYKGLTKHSLDSEGNLTNKYGAESTVAQASDISRLFSQANTGGKIDSTQLSAGLSRLMKAAQDSKSINNRGIPVQASFLRNWFTEKEMSEMLKSGDLKNQKYYMVLRKKTDEDNLLENTDLTATFGKEYTEKKLGNLIRKSTGNEDSFLGNLYGGYQYLKGAIHLGETAYNKTFDNDYRVEYVKQPRDGDEVIDDGKGNARKVNFVEITPRVIQKIADKITGKENTNIDIRGRNFVTDVQQGLVSSAKVSLDEDIKKMEEFRKTHPTDLDNNRKLISSRNRRADLSTTDASRIDYNLEEAYNEYDNLIKFEEKKDKEFKDSYENSRLATVGRNVGGLIDETVEAASDTLYNMSGGLVGKQKLTNKQKERAKYAMDRLMNEGLNKEQAAGIVGNIIKESQLDPKAGHTDNNGLHAGGIVQWNGPRYNAAKKYFGKPVEQVSFEDQFEYLIKELKGEVGNGAQERHGFLKKHGFKSGDNVLDVMKTTTSLRDSTDTFERIFEGSGDYAGYWTNKGKSNAKFHEGDRNKSRHELAATVYRNSGGNLSEVEEKNPTRESSNALNEVVITGKKKEEDKKSEAKSFLEIFKEKVSSFISNLGGFFNTSVNKANETASPVIDKVKETVLANGNHYEGNITKEFTDYNTYLANQGNLPKDLPAGLSYSDWKNRVYDMTGSMPQNLDLTPTPEAKPETQGLREDSIRILERYEKKAPTITADIAEPEGTSKITPEVPEIAQTNINVSESPTKNIWETTFNPESYEKKEDTIKGLSIDTKEIKKYLGQILGVNSANGMIMAQNVDATNNSTRANASAFMNLAKSVSTNQGNQVKPSQSLKDKNNSIKQLA